MIIDSHVNLHGEQYADDLDAVLDRAAAAGVGGMITICDRLENWSAVREVARRRDNIWCSLGVHPHYAQDFRGLRPETLVSLASEEPRLVGIGECGLDLYYAHSPIDDQVPVLLAHIEAARALDLPLIIHTRDADDLMGDVLEQEFARGAFGLLLHCYTSGERLARRALDLGAYFSLSGILTFKAANDVRAVASILPLDRIIVETDCPYLAPPPHRGRRNEPAYVKEVLGCFANLRGLSFDEAASVTTENFFRLFHRAVLQEGLS